MRYKIQLRPRAAVFCGARCSLRYAVGRAEGKRSFPKRSRVSTERLRTQTDVPGWGWTIVSDHFGCSDVPEIKREGCIQVCAVTGLGRSFIYQLQAAGSFPQRVKLGLRAVAWLEDEVQRWLSDKVAENRRHKSETE
jgi:prophage regulatory protein